MSSAAVRTEARSTTAPDTRVPAPTGRASSRSDRVQGRRVPPGGDGLVAQRRVHEAGDGRVGGAQAACLHHRGAAGVDDHDGFAVQLGVAAHLGGERTVVVTLGGLLGQPGEPVQVGGARRDELLGALRGGDGQQRGDEAGHREDREGQDDGEDAGSHEEGLCGAPAQSAEAVAEAADRWSAPRGGRAWPAPG